MTTTRTRMQRFSFSAGQRGYIGMPRAVMDGRGLWIFGKTFVLMGERERERGSLGIVVCDGRSYCWRGTNLTFDWRIKVGTKIGVIKG